MEIVILNRVLHGNAFDQLYIILLKFWEFGLDRGADGRKQTYNNNIEDLISSQFGLVKCLRYGLRLRLMKMLAVTLLVRQAGHEIFQMSVGHVSLCHISCFHSLLLKQCFVKTTINRQHIYNN